MIKKMIISVVGARPNFMKIAPLCWELAKYRQQVKHVIIHTGQHYDPSMSGSFFRDLRIPHPEVNLNVGSESHAVQTAQIMIGLEKTFRKYRPQLVLVVGDVNSTLAAALVASKINIPIAHIEAGLRSNDWSMPEEINRVITDRLSSFFFTTEKGAGTNLVHEGITKNVFFVGNLMIDSLLASVKIAKKMHLMNDLGLQKRRYCLVTLHRPNNVDGQGTLHSISSAFLKIQKEIKLVWPIHPRTKKMLEKFGIYNKLKRMDNVILLPPASYLDFLNLMVGSSFVMTDSGGIQEETTALGIPCLTLRENTERPITTTQGTNVIVGTSTKTIIKEASRIIDGNGKHGRIPKYWDGKTAHRIVRILLNKM